MDLDVINSQLFCSLPLTFAFLCWNCSLPHKLGMCHTPLWKLHHYNGITFPGSEVPRVVPLPRCGALFVQSRQDEKFGRILNVNALLLESENVWRVQLASPHRSRRGGGRPWRGQLWPMPARIGWDSGITMASLSSFSVASHIILLLSLESLPSFSLLVSHIWPLLIFHLSSICPPRATKFCFSCSIILSTWPLLSF